MATTYQQLLHSVGLRANALVGAQAAALETTYANTVLTSANFNSADFPFTSFRDAILQAEQDFVNAVAFTGEHPWKVATSICGTSSAVVSGAFLPIVDNAARPVVGLYGMIKDAADGIACVEMPMDVITRRVRNANSHYVTPVYYYKIDGQRIYHTRTGVVVDVTVYDRGAQVSSFNSNGNMLLPDPAEPGIVARALSFIFRDGVYAEQAAIWRQYSDEALIMIRSGIANIIPRSVPTPVTLARAN